ncbi:MAG: phage virion morphogenesis protein [Deltaproteobacteria bacterium]|nr:phage virion morphogenesis protein [Deltaproteobacteria bacterium]
MAGVGLKIEVKDKEVTRLLQRLQRRMANLTPVMSAVADVVRTSVVRTFEKEGRPRPWAGLSPVTVKLRGRAHPILRRQGFAGGLMGSIHGRGYRDRAEIGTNKVYAAVHQFGAKRGSFGTVEVRIPAHTRRITQAFGRVIEPKVIAVREHTRKMVLPWGDIPARPFMVVQDEDWEEIKETVLDALAIVGR